MREFTRITKVRYSEWKVARWFPWVEYRDVIALTSFGHPIESWWELRWRKK